MDIQKIDSKEYHGIPVQLTGRFDKTLVSLKPDTVSVKITGGASVLDSITNDNLELFIEYNRFAIEDVDSLAPTVKLKLPPSINRDMSINAIEVNPDKVALVRKEIKPVVFVEKSNEDYGQDEDEEDDES